HRIFSSLGSFYTLLIGAFEVLALLVLVSVVVFWIRRNVIRLQRFWKPEMKGWPKNDGNLRLYFELALMVWSLVMNATDVSFQQMGSGNVISGIIAPWFSGLPETTLHLIERTAWWMHIMGVLVFLNYLYYSKHLHIILAFPNTYFANLGPKGQLD